MKKALLAFAALATVAATGVATPSLADGLRVQVQYYDDGGYRPPRPGYPGPEGRRPSWGDGEMRGEMMSPRRVARSLQRRGYDVGDINLRRDTYFVRATRPNGRRVIVMVDAFSGRILGERRPGRGY